MSEVKVVGIAISNGTQDTRTAKEKILEVNRHMYSEMTNHDFLTHLHPEHYTHIDYLMKEVEYRSAEVMKKAMIDGIAVMRFNGTTLTVTLQDDGMYMLNGKYVTHTKQYTLLRAIKEHTYSVMLSAMFFAEVE
jgi:hypothetical protein